MIISDVNLLAPTITLAAGIALGYAFRGLIAREEQAALKSLVAHLQDAYGDAVTSIGRLRQQVDTQASNVVAKVEKAL